MNSEIVFWGRVFVQPASFAPKVLAAPVGSVSCSPHALLLLQHVEASQEEQDRRDAGANTDGDGAVKNRLGVTIDRIIILGHFRFGLQRP